MKCNGCNECCVLTEIPELNKPAGVMCQHVDIGIGCKIYGNRPQVCKDFVCSYAQMDEGRVNPKLNPQNCKCMFEKLTDNIFFGSISIGWDVKFIVESQVLMLNREGYSVILNSTEWDKPKISPSAGRTKEEVLKEYIIHMEKQYGRA